jgi:sporulation protein YlmC with PRC-barrel domain
MDGTPNLLSATTMMGDKVLNAAGEDLGEIEEFMIDLDDGRIAYAVLSFGGFLGLGDKLFAIPWDALMLDTDRKAFVLDVEKEELENAPGFDEDHWPESPENEWLVEVYRYYGFEPYWQ